MLQTRLAAAAQTLQRHILANQPWHVRCAAVLIKLAMSDKEMLTKLVAAHFLLRGVQGMKIAPLEDNERVMSLIEKGQGSTGGMLDKYVNQLSRLIPRGYFWDEADHIYRVALKTVQIAGKVRNSRTIDRLFSEAVGVALIKLQSKPVKEGAQFNQAAVYVKTILQNAMLDVLRAETRQKKRRERSLTDESGIEQDIEVEVDDTASLERAVSALPTFERQKFLRELLNGAWATGVAQDVSDQLVAMAIEGHTQSQISKELDISPATVSEFFKRWMPFASRTVNRYLAA